MKKLTLLLSFFLLLFFSSCKTNLLVIEDVLPTAKFEGFEPRFDQTSFTDFNLEMKLTYSFRNPYNKPLAIPSHRMGIKLNDVGLDGLWVEVDTLVPSKSAIPVHYHFTINSETLNAFLGKENKITFHTSMDLDISEYSNMLPNYNLKVTENFDIDSSQFKNVVKGLAQKKLKKRTLELEKSVSVKLPAPPVISKSTDPILVEWMGNSWTIINPNELKEALTPFADLLIDGQLGGLTNPFVQKMAETTVTVPAPTLTCWNCTKDMNISERALDLIRPFDSNIEDKWDDLKDLLYIDEEFSMTDYLVDNYLTKVNTDADVLWDGFQTGWSVLKNTQFPESIPSTDTKGFRISFPFKFYNANDFPIKIPLFRASTIISSGEPFSIQLRTKDIPEVPLNALPDQHAEIPAKQTETLLVTFSLNWQDSANGMYDFITGQPLNPNMEGVISYDFGYGPIFLKYDLMNLNVEHQNSN